MSHKLHVFSFCGYAPDRTFRLSPLVKQQGRAGKRAPCHHSLCEIFPKKLFKLKLNSEHQPLFCNTLIVRIKRIRDVLNAPFSRDGNGIDTDSVQIFY